RGQSTGMAR
ncbi:hypothetical protein D046_0912, partial [Vibrio parahaemolyticus V-223/04]